MINSKQKNLTAEAQRAQRKAEPICFSSAFSATLRQMLLNLELLDFEREQGRNMRKCYAKK